jgi:predicted GIY-YIG superfamily endonuclease
MAWVYILQTKSGNFYIGSTTNIRERLEHHLGGYTPSTKSLGAEKILLQQECKTLKDARWVEQRIKKLKRKDYIEKIIKDGYIKLTPPSLSW